MNYVIYFIKLFGKHKNKNKPLIHNLLGIDVTYIRLCVADNRYTHTTFAKELQRLR
jgi:hypothetical protein